MNSPVSTTLEHVRIVTPDADNQHLGGELLPKRDYEKRHGYVYLTVKRDRPELSVAVVVLDLTTRKNVF